MGLLTGELHPAHECHEVYYKNMKRSQPDVLIIENVVEYKLETAQSRLGRRYSCFDVCIDPRLFGFPTARARRYIVALKKCTVAWNPNISLHDVILCLRRQPIMSPMDYFFMPVPPTLLTSWYVAWRTSVEGWHAYASQVQVARLQVEFTVEGMGRVGHCLHYELQAENLRAYETIKPAKKIVDLQQSASKGRGRTETIDGSLPTLTTASGSLFSRAPWQRCSN